MKLRITPIIVAALNVATWIFAGSSIAKGEMSWLVHIVLSDKPVSSSDESMYVENEESDHHALCIVSETGTVSGLFGFGKRGWVLPVVSDGVAYVASDAPGNSTRISKVTLPALKEVEGSAYIVPHRRYVSYDPFGMWHADTGMTLLNGWLLFPTISVVGTETAEKGVGIELKSGKSDTFVDKRPPAYGKYLYFGGTVCILYPDGTGNVVSANGDGIKVAPFPQAVESQLRLPVGQGAFYSIIAQASQSAPLLTINTSNVNGASLNTLHLHELNETPSKLLDSILPISSASGDPCFLSWDPAEHLAAFGLQKMRQEGREAVIESSLSIVDLKTKKIRTSLNLNGLSAIRVDGENVLYAAGNRLMIITSGSEKGREIAKVPARRILEIFPLHVK